MIYDIAATTWCDILAASPKTSPQPRIVMNYDVAVRYRNNVAKIIAATPDCYDLRCRSDVAV